MMPRYALFALVLASIAVVGCEPKEQRPGFGLSGQVVEEAVTDWAFTDDHSTVFVETESWYLLPHSVTTVVFRHGDDLYVPSRNPEGKRWVSNVQRDHRVQLKIGDRIYPRRAVRVTDPTLIEEFYVAIGEKYDRLRHRPNEGPELWFFRMDPPGD
jgi:hypothetical protein